VSYDAKKRKNSVQVFLILLFLLRRIEDANGPLDLVRELLDTRIL